MAKRSSNSGNRVAVERARGGAGWVLSHPRAVRDCAEDLEEVRALIAAGEADVAVDELRWLVETCAEMIEAHFLLGKLAVEPDSQGRGVGRALMQAAEAHARAAGKPEIELQTRIELTGNHRAFERLGYTDVRVYPGGKTDWWQAGLPLEGHRTDTQAAR